MKNKESNFVKARSEKSLGLIDKKKIKFVPCKSKLKVKRYEPEYFYCETWYKYLI